MGTMAGEWCTGQDLNLQPSDPKSEKSQFRPVSSDCAECPKTIAIIGFSVTFHGTE
jgi:hypothetical protein